MTQEGAQLIMDASPELGEVIMRFLARFSSSQTRRTYYATLYHLSDFLSQMHGCSNIRVASISEDDLLAWRNHLEQSPKASNSARGQGPAPKPTTLARHLSAVRSFFRYAHLKKWVTENHALHLDPPRVPRVSRTSSLSPADCGKLLAALEQGCRSPKPREAAASALAFSLLVTLLTTGLRVSEVCGLRLGDVHLGPGAEPRLTVARKGGRTQTIYLHPMTVKALLDYLSKWRFGSLVASQNDGTQEAGHSMPETTGISALLHAQRDTRHEPLFVRSQKIKPRHTPRPPGRSEHAAPLGDSRSLVHDIGTQGTRTKGGVDTSVGPKALTPKSVWLMLTRASSIAGLEPRPSPHVLRATLATQMHRQGILLHQIQDLLGHSSITTTSLYVKRLRQAEESPSVRLQLATNPFGTDAD